MCGTYVMSAIHYAWTTMKKVQKHFKKQEMLIVCETWFVIFTLFVTQFFHISCSITDLPTELLFDEMSKEFFMWYDESVEIQMNYE